jgi:hypothetical protein
MLAFGLLLVLFLLFLFVLPARVPERHVRFERTDDGTLERPSPSSDPANRPFYFHIGRATQETERTFDRFVGTSIYGSPFDGEHLAVISGSGHPLVEWTGWHLTNEMKQLSFVDRLDYYPYGHWPEAGIESPDGFLWVDLVSISESWYGTLEATVFVSMGQRPVHDSKGKPFDHPMPELQWQTSGEMTLSSQQYGLFTHTSEYTLPAQHTAFNIARELRPVLTEFHREHRTEVEFPDCFYPNYREAPRFPFLNRYDAEQMYSVRDAAVYNETFWAFRSDQQMNHILQNVQRTLDDRGWNTQQVEYKPSDLPGLEMKKQQAILEVFPRNEVVHTFSRSRLLDHEYSKAEPVSAKRTYFVRYMHRFSTAKLNECIQTLFDNGRPLSTLLLFRNDWNDAHTRQFLERTTHETPTNAEAWRVASDLYQNKGQNRKARRALQRAFALNRCEGNESRRERIKQTAERAGWDAALEPPLPNKVLTSAGFKQLQPGGAPVSIEVDAKERARFFLSTSSGATTYCFRVRSDTGDSGNVAYNIETREVSGSYSSEGEVRIPDHQTDRIIHTDQVSGHAKVTCTAANTTNQAPFRIRCRAEKP